MAIATITLLIVNLVTVGSAAVYLGKEIDRTKKEIVDVEARTFAHMCKFTSSIKDEIKDLDKELDMKEIKDEIKNHISKEFLAMAYRGIKIADLSKIGGKTNE